jgi:hypothetical protein
MPNRSRKQKRPTDVNQLAHELVRLSTEEKPDRASRAAISEIMRAMGSKGGKIGGKVRASRMTSEERRESASRAARAMWAKRKKAERPI